MSDAENTPETTAEIPQDTPVDGLGIMAKQMVTHADGVEHHEFYTMQGLLSLLWYPADGHEPAVVLGGGAMGGILGGGGLFHDLGLALSAQNIPCISVGWRMPNNLDLCTQDMLAAMQLGARRGARRYVTVGHSFGGAIAIRAAASVHAELVPGVVTLATQSAGCEPASTLTDRQLLFFHGDADTILPMVSSEMVRMMAGTGELVVLPGGDHLLASSKDVILRRLMEWIPGTLG